MVNTPLPPPPLPPPPVPISPSLPTSYLTSLPPPLQVFDLKGSMRSRYVDPSKDRSGNVLLDENYLNCKGLFEREERLSFELDCYNLPNTLVYLSPPPPPHTQLDICNTPVYVHPHSKRVLMQAISMDTQFLAENHVMDYSLLACVEDVTGELVLGIIGRSLMIG